MVDRDHRTGSLLYRTAAFAGLRNRVLHMLEMRGRCWNANFGIGFMLVTLAPAGGVHARTLYSFQGGSDDGAFPYADVTLDSAGNLYGTTWQGAGGNCGGYACGTVFKLAPGGTETVLHRFSGGSDGANPLGARRARTKEKHGARPERADQRRGSKRV
jgi:hypothetical protein